MRIFFLGKKFPCRNLDQGTTGRYISANYIPSYPTSHHSLSRGVLRWFCSKYASETLRRPPNTSRGIRRLQSTRKSCGFGMENFKCILLVEIKFRIMVPSDLFCLFWMELALILRLMPLVPPSLFHSLPVLKVMHSSNAWVDSECKLVSGIFLSMCNYNTPFRPERLADLVLL